jgi:hypothetical protein
MIQQIGRIKRQLGGFDEFNMLIKEGCDVCFAVGGDESRISGTIHVLLRVHAELSNYNGDGGWS